MRYFSKFIWIFVLGGIWITWNILTSPDAGTAGYRSSGIVMLLLGAGVIWFILEILPQKEVQKI